MAAGVAISVFKIQGGELGASSVCVDFRLTRGASTRRNSMVRLKVELQVEFAHLKRPKLVGLQMEACPPSPIARPIVSVAAVRRVGARMGRRRIILRPSGFE